MEKDPFLQEENRLRFDVIRDISIRILSFTVRRLFSLRYRVHLHGLDEVKKILKSDKPVVVLPNHPAMTDTWLLYSIIGQIVSLKPVMLEKFFTQKGLYWIYRLLQAIPVPDFEVIVNEWKARQGDRAYEEILKTLNRKEKVIIYPGGTLKNSSKESLRGKSAVHRLLSEEIDLEVILVRTTGLWGSSFSHGILGNTPDSWETLKKSFFLLWKNLIFFMPKRDVTIEFYRLPSDFSIPESKMEFNRFLEGWYNQYKYQDATESEERPNLVPYLFWDKKGSTPKAYLSCSKTLDKDVKVPVNMREMILSKLSKMTGFPKEHIHPEQNLAVDLGCDSIDLSNLILFLEQKFPVSSKFCSLDIVYVQDLFLVALNKKVPCVNEILLKEKSRGWKEQVFAVTKRFEVLGKTIPEAFIHRMKLVADKEIVADKTVTLTGKETLFTTILLAGKIRKIEGKYIGIILQPCVDESLILFAAMLAGKVPVLINWNNGYASTDELMRMLSIKSVFTSRKFLDHEPHFELGNIEPLLVMIEDFYTDISVFEKLNAHLLASKSTSSILSHFGLDGLSEDVNALVLCKCISEHLPKFIPLTHKNLIVNIEDLGERLLSQEISTFLCCTALYYSNGLIVTTLLPLLNGLRVFFSQELTYYPFLAKQIQDWGIDFLDLTVSKHYKELFNCCEPAQLVSLRFLVSENATQSVRDKLKKINPKAKIYLGFGTTETSVLTSQTHKDQKPKGLGRALKRVELIVVDPQDLKPVSQGVEGEVLAHGPSIFNGYLDEKLESPFVNLNGKSFFRTGYFGYLDTKGNLITDNKRGANTLTRVSGNLVKLPMIEQFLTYKAKELGWSSALGNKGNSFVVIPLQTEDKKNELVLISSLDVSLDEVNKIIAESALPNFCRLHRLLKVTEIPLLSSGNADVKALTELAHREFL